MLRRCDDGHQQLLVGDSLRRKWPRYYIAGIWVAFFSRCQRYRCRQDLAPVFFDSDAVAAVIGFWGGIAGQVAGVLLSMASDFVGGRKRAMLIVLSGLSVLLITYFTIMCKQHMEAG